MLHTVKYREYHRLLQSGDFEEAASILVKVLNSPDMAPRWYWIDLVREACCLLRAAPQQAAVFNVEEVCLRACMVAENSSGRAALPNSITLAIDSCLHALVYSLMPDLSLSAPNPTDTDADASVVRYIAFAP